MNRIKNLRWLFLAAVLFIGGQIHSQTVLSIDSAFLITLPDTIITLPYSLPDTIVLTNAGPAYYSGTIAIGLSVNGGPGFIDNNGAGVTFDANNNSSVSDSVSMPPHTSATFAIHVHFTSPAFSAGPSVVVIWPIAVGSGNNVTVDTLQTDTIKIQQAAAITGPIPAGLKVYTVYEQLWIKCNEANVLKHVRIYDITGRLIMEQDLSSTTSIPMNGYSDGIYLAEIRLTNNQLITYKIFSGH